MRLATTCAVAVALALAHTATARGDGDAAARREAHRRVALGTRYYDQGRYEDALRVYQAAYDIYPDASILFNLGLAREKTFDYERCALAFRQFIDSDPDAASRDRAQQRMDSCLERTLVPVKLSSWPPNAAVAVRATGAEGAPSASGRTPITLQLPPGTHEIELQLPGHRAELRTVTVAPGQRPSIDVTLERLSTLQVEADVSGATATVDEGAPEPLPMSRELPAGLYRVRVERDGHKSVTREVRVSPGQQLSLVVSLPALPRRRLLAIRAPQGATVAFDSEPARPASARHRLLSGEHTVDVRADGYLPFHDDIVVTDDRDLMLEVALAPRRSKAQRAVTWGLLGAAGASAVAGTFFGVRALTAEDDYDSLPSMRLLEEGRRDARRADLLLGGAVVLATSAGIHYLLTKPRASRARMVRPR